MPSSIIHDDVSESHVHVASTQPESTSTEEMRFFPRWIGCQRTATPTLSSSSSFQCPSHMNSVRSEWRVEDFEQEVSLYFVAPDLPLDLDTPLRNQSSSATLTLQQSSGTVTPIPRKNVLNDAHHHADRRSSFLKFNLGELFRPPVSPPSIGFQSDTHFAPAPAPAPLSASPPSQTQDHTHNLVSLPSASSASVSTYASASAFTVASSSHPSISTYASASASVVAPSSASTSGGRSRKSRRTPSHFSSSSCSYSYPYSEYMSSSSSGLSAQENYLDDIAAGIDTTTTATTTTTTPITPESPEPTSPTTTTTSSSTTSSSSPSKRSNLVRRLRLRGGADENYLKLKSLNAGISSSGGIFSSPSPNKSPSRTKSRLGLKADDHEDDHDHDEDSHHVYPRPNPNAKLKKRFIFVELDQEGHIIDRRGGGGGKTSSYHIDESTLRQREAAHTHSHTHTHHNDTIGKTSSPLAIAAEHLSSTLSHNPLFHLRFRKQKRLLVKDIPTDDGDFTRSRIVALRQWAESLGAVRRLMRSIPDGTIWIEFKDREVAENVCHLHAHVHIPNVGRVRLDWVEGREAG